MQVGVGHGGGGHTQGALVTQPSHGDGTVVGNILAYAGIGSAGRYGTGTVLTPGSTELEEVDPADVLDELLIGKNPCGGCTVEIGELVVLTEGGITVTTEVESSVVLVVERIVGTEQITYCGGDNTRTGRSPVLSSGQVVLLEVHGNGEAVVTNAEAIGIGIFTGVTGHGVNVVLAEVSVIGEDVVHIPGTVLAHGRSTLNFGQLIQAVGVVHFGGNLSIDKQLRIIEYIRVGRIALTLDGELIAQTLDEGEINLGIGDTIDVGALGGTVGPEVGVAGTATPVRAGRLAVGNAVIPVLVTRLDGVNEGERAHPDSILDLCGLAPAVSVEVITLDTNLQPVRYIDVNLGHGAELFVVVTLADALLTGIVGGYVVVHPLRAATYANIIFLALALAGNLVQPVGPHTLIPCFLLTSIEQFGSGGIQAGVIAPFFVLEVDITGALLGIETVLEELLLVGDELGHTGPVRNAVAGVEAHLRCLAGCILSGDDDNTVSSTGTVDGGSGSILQDVNALDVGRVDGVDGAIGNDTVHNEQRLVDALSRGGYTTATRNGVLTTDGHRGRVIAACSGCRSIAETGDAAGQCRQGIRVREGSDVLVVGVIETGDGAGDITLTGGTVTHNYYVVQEQGVLFENDFDVLLTADSNFYCLVANGRDDQGGAIRDADAENTIQISCYSGGRALDQDSGTDHRFALIVDNRTGDDILSERLHTYYQACKRNHNESF